MLPGATPERASAPKRPYDRPTDVARVTEDDFRSLFDQAGDLVVLVDGDWRIASVNDAITAMLGYAPDDLVGREAKELFVAEVLDDVRARYRGLVRAELTTTTYETLLRAADGRPVPVEVTTTILSREGEVVGAMGVARDVTQRHEAERALRQRESQLAEAQRMAHIGSWDWDLAADTISWSDEMYRISGIEPGGAPLGYDAYMSLVHADDRGEVLRTVEGALGTGGPFETLYRIVGPDGAERVIHGHGVVTLDGDGAPLRMAGTARDVTDEHRAREDHRRLQEEFLHAQKLEALALLSGEIAHDFNNALTAIRGYAQLVLDQLDPDSPAGRDALELCRTAEHATALPRQLLAFARRQSLRARELDLTASLHELRPLLEHVLGVEHRLVVPEPAEPIWVRADPGQLEQALVNVTLNARDAMEGDSGELTVALGVAEVDAASARELDVKPGRFGFVRVGDTGTGMDEETLARATEPFFTTKQGRGGTGLGLPAVAGSVTQSGGALRIESRVGQGTTVEILLPVAEPPVRPATPPPRARRGDRVLVVDDEPQVLAVIARVLDEAGFTVTATTSSVEALDRIRADPASAELLVTDLRMPDLGGAELAREARRVDPELAVLFLSGFPEDLAADEPVSLLPKPFSPEELVAAVEQRLTAPERLRR
jgi:PAS domain S-box-containing protein